MAAPSVEAVVTLKSGEQHTFRHEVDRNNGSNQYKQLRENLKKVQGDVNTCLTQQVEREKAENKPNAAGDTKQRIADDSAEGGYGVGVRAGVWNTKLRRAFYVYDVAFGLVLLL